MKSIVIKATVIGAIIIMATGCSIKDVGATKNSVVSSMSSDSAYTINKTTLTEAQGELGSTGLIFKKEDGKIKYVWTSRKTSWGLGYHEDTIKSLALTFDKNNILIAKKFGVSPYEDPDVLKLKADMLGQVQNGNLTSTDEAKKAEKEASANLSNPMSNFADQMEMIGKIRPGM